MVVNRVIGPDLGELIPKASDFLASSTEDPAFVGRVRTAVDAMAVAIDQQASQIALLQSTQRETVVLPEFLGAIHDLEGIRFLADDLGQTFGHGNSR
jgi:hypothetical protein